MGRKFFVGGNWKSNGTTEDVKSIVNALNVREVPSSDVVEVVISPTFVFLQLVKSLLKPQFDVAAQNCWVNNGGALTGEVSVEMLINLDIPWVILGHSERRLFLKESNEFVGEKVAHALSKGLKVIACVGETLEQREAGSTTEVVAAQIKAIEERVKNWSNIVLAYEPVWAIGTGKVATPADAQEVHSELRKWLHENTSPEVAATTRIIYGGSINGANCMELAAQPDVDGFLVGGVSLEPEFIDIIKSSEVKKNDGGADANELVYENVAPVPFVEAYFNMDLLDYVEADEEAHNVEANEEVPSVEADEESQTVEADEESETVEADENVAILPHEAAGADNNSRRSVRYNLRNIERRQFWVLQNPPTIRNRRTPQRRKATRQRQTADINVDASESDHVDASETYHVDASESDEVDVAVQPNAEAEVADEVADEVAGHLGDNPVPAVVVAHFNEYVTHCQQQVINF